VLADAALFAIAHRRLRRTAVCLSMVLVAARGPAVGVALADVEAAADACVETGRAVVLDSADAGEVFRLKEVGDLGPIPVGPPRAVRRAPS